MVDKEIKKLQYSLAYIVTNACYRNLDVVEDSHAGKSIKCEHAFYKKVYFACSEKLDEWIPRLSNELKYMSKYKKCNDIEAGFLLMDGIQMYEKWEIPKKIKADFKDDIALFMLDGEFKKACDEGWIFDDHSMKIINVDINNRVFTLISRQIIEL